MKALHSRYRMIWTMALLAASPLLAGAAGDGCSAGGKISVGSGGPANDAGASADAAVACTQADCAGLPVLGDAKLCSDGSNVGRSVCAMSPYTGTCEWDFPACPPLDAGSGSGSGDGSTVPSCMQADCAGLGAPALAKVCPAGTSVGATLCAFSPSTMRCDWTFPDCPPSDAGSGCVCSGPMPGAPSGICPDGSMFGPECIETVSVPSTCSWSVRTCPATDAGPACTTISQKATAFVQIAVDANTSCTTDADCTVVNFQSDCFDACTRVINKAGVAAVQSAIDSENAGICMTFKTDGCMLLSPPCVPPLPASCVAGRCQ